MAKPLVFQFGDQELAFTLNKVDRSKLYGYKEVEALDDQGRPCQLATIAEDGCTVVASGGTAMGTMSVDGLWCEKSQLKPIDLSGNEIQPVASSYSAPIKLFDTVSVDQYLSHNIRSVYQLEIEAKSDELLCELKRGTIFSFPYSFRGGLEADAGFLLLNDEDNLFLAVGSPTKVDFIGFQQTAAAADEEDGDDETDLMDFDMI